MKHILKALSFILLFVTFTPQIEAQFRGYCGCTAEDLAGLTEQIESYKKTAMWESRAFPEMDIQIPVTFYSVYHDGSDAVTEEKILGQLCKLNSDFKPTGFQFYLRGGIDGGIIYRKDQAINVSPSSAVASRNIRNLVNANRGAINIFIVDNATRPNNNGLTLGYWNRIDDYIVMLDTEVEQATASLSHECGHLFSLSHTFYGWEATEYDNSKPTPEFVNIGGVNIRVEYVSRTKTVNGVPICEVSADRLCDTPADYNLGFGWNGCNYNGGAKDPDGEVLDPMEDNFMGYFIGCDPYVFTADQVDMMMTDYNTNSRREPYKTDNNQPDLTPLDNEVVLVSPENHATPFYYDEVVFEWEDIAGADFYYLEVARNSTFSTLNQVIKVSDNTYTLNNLSPGTRYFWRVSAYNEGGQCGARGSARDLRTSNIMTSVDNKINGIDNWAILPNPSTHGESTRLEINAQTHMSLDLHITNLTGQVMLAKTNVDISSGKSNISLPLSDWENGVYLIKIQNGDEWSTRRLVIARL